MNKTLGTHQIQSTWETVVKLVKGDRWNRLKIQAPEASWWIVSGSKKPKWGYKTEVAAAP